MAKKIPTTDAEEANLAPDAHTFESALASLEEVVEQLESGDGTLEAALALYERGIALSDHCQKALDAAEQKVAILSQRGADGDTASGELAPFEAGDDV